LALKKTWKKDKGAKREKVENKQLGALQARRAKSASLH
jgi:hypothetical protein